MSSMLNDNFRHVSFWICFKRHDFCERRLLWHGRHAKHVKAWKISLLEKNRPIVCSRSPKVIPITFHNSTKKEDIYWQVARGKLQCLRHQGWQIPAEPRQDRKVATVGGFLWVFLVPFFLAAQPLGTAQFLCYPDVGKLWITWELYTIRN